LSSGGEQREGAKMIPGHMQISGETGIVHPPISLYISNPQTRFCHLILNYILNTPPSNSENSASRVQELHQKKLMTIIRT